MEILSELEVDINGRNTFWVSKSILSSFCGKLRRSQALKMAATGNKLKVTFQDFPGGPDGFELITRFCYSKGKIEISHSNILMLNSAAVYMEIPGLLAQTEKFLQRFDCWTWSELLISLKQGQNQLLAMGSSPSIAQKTLVDELVRRLSLLASDPSSKCSSFRSSCDSASTKTASSSFRSLWFFEDLSVLEIEVINMVVNRMLVEKFEHSTISKFLFCYQKSRLFGTMKGDEKVRVLQGVINLYSLLNKRSIPTKVLFHTLRKASLLKLSRCSMKKLELLIGSHLDQATLDDLLVPSPSREACVYDVNMAIRLLKIFLGEPENRWKGLSMKRVGRLMDLYAMEIAPDVCLKPSKFAAVIVALPDSARDSCERIYRAVDLYLEVHQAICEEDRMRVASAVNYEKLPPEALVHLAQNVNFPVKVRFKTLMYQDLKIDNHPSRCVYDHLKMLGNRWGYGLATRFKKKRVVEFVKATDERVRSHVLKQMGLEFSELEGQLGRKQQGQLSSNLRCAENVMYLPRLCS